MANSKLSDKEKWECVARWLNGLYIAYVNEEKMEVPCERCPYIPDTCACTVPPPVNFKVIEQFTGEGTVVSPFINQGAILL